MGRLAEEGLTRAARDLRTLCDATHRSSGCRCPAACASRATSWSGSARSPSPRRRCAGRAVNQLDRSVTEVVLPKLLLGGAWTGQNADPARPSAARRSRARARRRRGDAVPAHERARRHAPRRDDGPRRQGRPRHRHLHPGGRSRRRGRTRSSRRCSAARPTAAARACSTAGTSSGYEPIRDATGRDRRDAVHRAAAGLARGDPRRRRRLAHRRDRRDLRARRERATSAAATSSRPPATPTARTRGTRRTRAASRTCRSSSRAAMEASGRDGAGRRSRCRAGAGAPRERVAAVTYFAPWDWVIVAEMDRDEAVAALREVQSSLAASAVDRGLGVGVLLLAREHLGGPQGREPARRAARGDGRRRRAHRGGRRAAGGHLPLAATRSAGSPRRSAAPSATSRRSRAAPPRSRAAISRPRSCSRSERDELTRSFQSAQSELRRARRGDGHARRRRGRGAARRARRSVAPPGRLPRGRRGRERHALDARRPPRRDARARP